MIKIVYCTFVYNFWHTVLSLKKSLKVVWLGRGRVERGNVKDHVHILLEARFPFEDGAHPLTLLLFYLSRTTYGVRYPSSQQPGKQPHMGIELYVEIPALSNGLDTIRYFTQISFSIKLLMSLS